jgi:hypothetical protein
MARDVARRELDQANFRILKLGDPKEAGDATKTDNQTTPKPASGAGSPGTSFLAAPADHVHPAGQGGSGGSIALDDPTMQSASGGGGVIWEQVVDFSHIPGDKVACFLSAWGQVNKGQGKIELKLGGDSGQSDGLLIVTVPFSSPGGEAVAKGPGTFTNPKAVSLVKIVATTDAADATMLVRSKTIFFTVGAQG